MGAPSSFAGHVLTSSSLSDSPSSGFRFALRNMHRMEFGMRIYVGSLAESVTDESLRAAFAPYGEVASADVITDRYTGQSRGFGFVEIRDNEGAQQAIRALDGSDLNGRTLRVNEARPRTENRGGGGGGGGRGGDFGGRGGGGGGGGRW